MLALVGGGGVRRRGDDGHRPTCLATDLLNDEPGRNDRRKTNSVRPR